MKKFIFVALLCYILLAALTYSRHSEIESVEESSIKTNSFNLDTMRYTDFYYKMEINYDEGKIVNISRWINEQSEYGQGSVDDFIMFLNEDGGGSFGDMNLKLVNREGSNAQKDIWSMAVNSGEWTFFSKSGRVDSIIFYNKPIDYSVRIDSTFNEEGKLLFFDSLYNVNYDKDVEYFEDDSYTVEIESKGEKSFSLKRFKDDFLDGYSLWIVEQGGVFGKYKMQTVKSLDKHLSKRSLERPVPYGEFTYFSADGMVDSIVDFKACLGYNVRIDSGYSEAGELLYIDSLWVNQYQKELLYVIED